MNVLVFGGTSEGRELVEWLAARGDRVVACCATEYGGELLSGLEGVEVITGALDDAEKDELIAKHGIDAVVDATHPYATHITRSVRRLASMHGLKLLRLARGDDGVDGTIVAESVGEAARYVASISGNILLTTGTKDLATFVEAIPDFKDRLYARVLSVPDSVAKAHDLGIPASHIIAMQGPFSHALNCALLEDLSIKAMVTKASGKAGGYSEKLSAARQCGVEVVVIGRPDDEPGYTIDQVKSYFVDHRPASEEGMRVSLVGMGPGNASLLTGEALRAIEESELIIGASRLLEQVAWKDCEKHALVRADDIVGAIAAAAARKASVLFSGDVGFYSGATALSSKLGELATRQGNHIEVVAIPGISSLVYFCARLAIPWQDAHLVSAHGRASEPVAEVKAHAKTFFLTGGKTGVREICHILERAGLGEVNIAVGERLSYDDERITKGTAADLAQRDFEPLAVMLVENAAVAPRSPGKLEVS